MTTEFTSPPIDTYYSPFDHYFDHISPGELNFSGTLHDLLVEIEKELTENNKKAIITRIPQILRPIIQFKIKHPDNTQIIRAYAQAIQIVTRAYRGELEATYDGFEELAETLEDLPDLLDEKFSERGDAASWLACDPKYSQRSVETIRGKTNKDVILVPLANGALRAGFDVYNRLQSQSSNRKNIMYPVRFSRNKKGDRGPQISDTDIRYLQKKVDQGYDLVVLEEDSDTGQTREQAERFFSKLLGDKNVFSVTNYDSLTDW